MPDPSASMPLPAPTVRPARPLLQVVGLTLGFPSPARGFLPIVRDVSFEVRRGEVLGLVGESGCGKSLTALALLGLLPPAARITGGRIELDGLGDLLALPEARRRALRGTRIAMIFQEPAAALNPVLTIGFQIREALCHRRRLGAQAARQEAARLLARVAMPDPLRRLESYPHQLSGGQAQRAMIALALACGPDLLIADEPTTALDVTVQAQVLQLLADLQRELGLSILLITHDLAVIAQCCDRVMVMSAGEIVEEAPVERLFVAPAHPCTRALLAALPPEPR